MYALMVEYQNGKRDIVQGSIVVRGEQSLLDLKATQEHMKGEYPELNYYVVKIDMEIVS
jgi:hypothetical protein